jgi:hypothetical protein
VKLHQFLCVCWGRLRQRSKVQGWGQEDNTFLGNDLRPTTDADEVLATGVLVCLIDTFSSSEDALVALLDSLLLDVAAPALALASHSVALAALCSELCQLLSRNCSSQRELLTVLLEVIDVHAGYVCTCAHRAHAVVEGVDVHAGCIVRVPLSAPSPFRSCMDSPMHVLLLGMLGVLPQLLAGVKRRHLACTLGALPAVARLAEACGQRLQVTLCLPARITTKCMPAPF